MLDERLVMEFIATALRLEVLNEVEVGSSIKVKLSENQSLEISAREEVL